MMTPKDKTAEDVAVIKTKIGYIEEFIKDIKNNHLHSIYKQLKDVESKMLSRLPGWATIIITLLSSIVTGLIVYGAMRK